MLLDDTIEIEFVFENYKNETMKGMYFDARINSEQLQSDIANINKRLSMLTSGIQESGDKIDSTFSKIGAGFATYFSTIQLSAFMREMVNVRGEFQKFDAVLTNTLDGDKVKASGLLDGLAEFAAKTPYQLNDITENFVKLANQGIVLTQQELVKLGDFAAVTGKPIGQLFEAIMDINNPERWKEFGARIQTEGEKVSITFRNQRVEFDRTIAGAKNAISELGSMKGVSGTMEVISETLIGQISNMEDAWDRMLNNLGKANEGTFSGMISGATELITNYQTVLDVMKGMIITFGAAKTAAVVYNLVMKEQAAVNAMVAASNGVFTRSLALQWLWTERAQKAQALLNKTMLTNPYVLAVAAVTGLIVAIGYLNKKYEESIDAKRNFDEHTRQITDNYQARIDKANNLISILKSETEAEAKRIEALNELKAIYPGIFGEMDIHSAKLKTLQAETKNLNEEESKLNLQRQQEYIKQLEKQRNELQKSIDDSRKNADFDNVIASTVAANEFKKITELNKQIELENERYNKMLLDQQAAQDQARKEAEKTISQRIREAKSIDELNKLSEEWQKKWKAATTDKERNQFSNEIDLITAALKRMKGEGDSISLKQLLNEDAKDAVKNIKEALERKKQLEERLGTGTIQQEVQLIFKINEAQASIDEFYKQVRTELNKFLPINLFDAAGKNEKINPLSTKGLIAGKKEITDLLKPMKTLTDEEQKRLELLLKQLEAIEQQNETYKDSAEVFKGFSDVFGALSYATGSLDDDLSKTFGTLSDLAYNTTNLFANLGEGGNVFAAVSSGIGVLGSLINLFVGNFREAKKEAEELRDVMLMLSSIDKAKGTMLSKDWVKYTEIQMDLLQKNIERSMQTYDPFGLSDAFNLSKISLALDYYNKISEIQGGLTEGQQEQLDKFIEWETKYNELQQQAWDRVTGTTQDAVADSIVDGFKQGFDSAADFAETFEGLMKTAIINAFKTQLIEGDLTEWYKGFAEAGKDGYTEKELEYWKGEWEKLLMLQGNKWDNIEKITGVNPNNPIDKSQQGLTGAVRNITEETAGLIAGQFSAMRELNQKQYTTGLEQLNGINQSVAHLAEIAANTRHNAKLVSIDEGIKNMEKIMKECL